MIRLLVLLAALICAVPAACPGPKLPAGADPQNTLLIDTKHGRIVIKLRPDLAPKHVERIKQLAREGYYNNVPFHRVIDGLHGADRRRRARRRHRRFEVSEPPGRVHPARRSSAASSAWRARSDPNSANSQFFIMFGERSFLNGQYTVIGEVAVRHGRRRQDQEAASRRAIPTA